MPNIGSSPPASISTTTTANEILSIVPSAAFPTTNFNQIIRTIEDTTTVYSYLKDTVDLFNISVDNETGNFTVTINELNLVLAEDSFKLLLEDGNDLSFEG